VSEEITAGQIKKWNSFKTIWLKELYYPLFVPGVAAEKSNENIQSLLHFLKEEIWD
jgi:hypothetical protein